MPSSEGRATSPYDIEEIFPEDAGGVRLPRRQAGSAPQGLAVTLLADYTLRARAHLPSAAIVDLLGETGVSQAGARTAISRLARRGVLEADRRGRRSFYRLTPDAATFLRSGGGRIVSSTAEPEPWDGQWTLIAFSLPQEEAGRRRGLRGRLRWMGFAPLYDGLWVSPHDLTEKAKAQLGPLTPGATTVFRARQLDLDAALRRSPIDAWDLGSIADEYESFIARWSPLVGAGRIGGPEAVRARTEVMDSYRRLPILDPRLPARLLPPGWPRGRAAEVFIAVYDGLADVAQEHVRAVASRHADGPLPGVGAHSVAELRAGLTG